VSVPPNIDPSVSEILVEKLTGCLFR
jgi:hypothetical protein